MHHAHTDEFDMPSQSEQTNIGIVINTKTQRRMALACIMLRIHIMHAGTCKAVMQMLIRVMQLYMHAPTQTVACGRFHPHRLAETNEAKHIKLFIIP